MDDPVPGWRRVPVAGDEAGDAPAPESAAVARTFIDAGAAFEGTLRLREGLRIDSEFRGEIVSEGTVVVGEAAGIEADIRAREVVILGAVVGNVFGRRQVTLRAGARLHGDVETPCLEIERHAFFNGRTAMARPESGLRDSASPPRHPLPRRLGTRTTSSANS